MAENETAPDGWYPDTCGTQLRWWDGAAWSDHVAPVSSADPVPAVEFVAERKRVYSHDMLYVTDAAGTKVGRINLETGKVTIDPPELRPEFDEFVARWRAENIAATEADETPADDPGLSTATVEDQPVAAVDSAFLEEAEEEGPGWKDLSQNRAGQAVRERAVELRSEAPVKTFVARVFGVHTDERAYRVGPTARKRSRGGCASSATAGTSCTRCPLARRTATSTTWSSVRPACSP